MNKIENYQKHLNPRKTHQFRFPHEFTLVKAGIITLAITKPIQQFKHAIIRSLMLQNRLRIACSKEKPSKFYGQ